MSPGLIPEAAMRMRISPGPGAGSGISPMVRTSLAGPCFSYQAALMESSISQKSRTAQFNPNSLILAAECFQAEVAQYREVLGLYRKREGQYACTSTCVRALSIQRLEGSHPGFAADAGPMQIQWWEGAASSCAEAALQSATRDCMKLEAGRMRKRIVSSVVEELEKDVRSEGRHRGTERVEKHFRIGESRFMPQP